MTAYVSGTSTGRIDDHPDNDVVEVLWQGVHVVSFISGVTLTAVQWTALR